MEGYCARLKRILFELCIRCGLEVGVERIERATVLGRRRVLYGEGGENVCIGVIFLQTL